MFATMATRPQTAILHVCFTLRLCNLWQGTSKDRRNPFGAALGQPVAKSRAQCKVGNCLGVRRDQTPRYCKEHSGALKVFRARLQSVSGSRFQAGGVPLLLASKMLQGPYLARVRQQCGQAPQHLRAKASQRRGRHAPLDSRSHADCRDGGRGSRKATSCQGAPLHVWSSQNRGPL